MATRQTERRRVKISATLDPALIQAVDAYVADHAGVDRSAVIDEALGLWYARQQQLAMEAQYAPGGDDGPPEEEWAAWQAIRRAAAERLIAKPDER
jgi:hypothetical protein